MPLKHDRRRRDKMLIGCTVICTICTIVVVAVVAPTVVLTSGKAESNQDANQQIQRARADSIRTACADQNERHDFALVVTNRLLAKPAVPSQTRRLTPQEQQARDAAIRTWVSALVPRRDCDLLVRRSVK